MYLADQVLQITKRIWNGIEVYDRLTINNIILILS